MTTVVFWHWFIVGALLLALEVISPAIIMLWFGLGAIVTGIVLWLVPDLSVGIQLVIFAVFSLASLYLWRHSPWYKARRTPASDSVGLNDRVNKHVGQVYNLMTPIEYGKGMVEVDGTYWQVRGNVDLPMGAAVRVTSTEGTTFNVEPA